MFAAPDWYLNTTNREVAAVPAAMIAGALQALALIGMRAARFSLRIGSLAA
jgi:hypothetical protein